MAYPLEIYVKLQDIPLLEDKFKNLEPFVRIYTKDKEMVERAIKDPEYAKTKIAEFQAKLDDLKLDMETILLAIELLKSDELNEEEFEDDDE